jgi:hypothetical protein
MRIPTNPMYDINLEGVVTLISTGEIIPEFTNRRGRRAVKIRGKSHKVASHPIDRLMLNTYKPLPEGEDPEWKSVEYIDRDRCNISIDNLNWSDKWYHPQCIPGVTTKIDTWILIDSFPELEMRISFRGAIFRCSTTHKPARIKYDAYGYQIVTSLRSKTDARAHRLIALTLLPHPIDTDHLIVNHKDSDKGNNTPHNLEWSTYSQNNTHAFAEGPRGDTIRKIIAKNLTTHQECELSGYNDAARYIGVSPGSIHSIMDRRRFEGRPYKGHVFKYADDVRTWDELTNSSPVEKRVISEHIACRNMDTGIVTIYDSVAGIIKSESITEHTLYRLLSVPYLIPWRRRCFQKYVDGYDLKWPQYPEEILQIYEDFHSSDKPLTATDEFGVTTYYPNITRWCIEDRNNRLDPAVLCRYLKKHNRWKNWVFEFIDLKKYPLQSSNDNALMMSHSSETMR